MKLKDEIARIFVKRIEARAKAQILGNPKLKEYLQHYARTSPSTGCSYSDYAVLYNWIRKNKPKEVLELGTGYSTLVIYQALKENEAGGFKGRLVSMEENKDYYEAALRSLPKGVNVEIVLSPTVEDTYDFFRGVRYKDVPKRDYDLVFVDGPDKMMHPKSHPLTFCMDVLSLVGDHPLTAIIDKRLSTCFVYSLLFKSFRYDFLREIGMLGPVTKKDLRSGREISQKQQKKLYCFVFGHEYVR